MSFSDLPFFPAGGAAGDAGVNGKDGVSPTITVTNIEGGHRLTIVDATGTKTVDILNGASGKSGTDGTSVTVKSISESTADEGNNIVTFSDGKSLTIKNGSKGSPGENGLTPSINASGNWQIGSTDTGVKAVGADGKDGTNGTNGEDGRGIKTVTINEQGELVVTYTDDNSENLGKVVGEAGGQGPVYILTAEDKADIVAAVLDELNTQT